MENFLDLESKAIKCLSHKEKVYWNYIRTFTYFIKEYSDEYIVMNVRARGVALFFKNVIYGLKCIFSYSSIDYIFFNNANKRYLIDNSHKDVYFDHIADRYGQENCLFIEFAEKKHFQSECYSKHVQSDLLFKLLGRIIGLFIRLDRNFIDKIVSEFDIPSAKNKLKSIIKYQRGEYYIYNLLFKIIKPKKVFVICYYTKIPIIEAAIANRVPVYEVQHGVITENNVFYTSLCDLGFLIKPHYLLSYGMELQELSNFIFKKESIIPVGSYYLDYIYENFNNEYLRELKLRFENIYCVTLGALNVEVVMKFVERLSKEEPTSLFIVRPKRNEDVSSYLNSSIIVLPDFDIYMILKYSNFNITIASMTALESDYYGVFNILLNVNGESRKYISSEIFGVFIDDYIEGNYSSLYFNKLKNAFKPRIHNAFFVDSNNTSYEI